MTYVGPIDAAMSLYGDWRGWQAEQRAQWWAINQIYNTCEQDCNQGELVDIMWDGQTINFVPCPDCQERIDTLLSWWN